MVWGLIELYEASFQPEYLKKALVLSEDMLRVFWDDENGGFLFTGNDAEEQLEQLRKILGNGHPAGGA